MVSIPAAHPVSLNLISQKDYATRLVTTFGCCYLVIHLVISLVAKNISYRREKKATILYSCNTFLYQKNLVKQTLLENFNPENVSYPLLAILALTQFPYINVHVYFTPISLDKKTTKTSERESILYTITLNSLLFPDL